jgi:hypothetical protein
LKSSAELSITGNNGSGPVVLIGSHLMLPVIARQCQVFPAQIRVDLPCRNADCALVNSDGTYPGLNVVQF